MSPIRYEECGKCMCKQSFDFLHSKLASKIQFWFFFSPVQCGNLSSQRSVLHSPPSCLTSHLATHASHHITPARPLACPRALTHSPQTVPSLTQFRTGSVVDAASFAYSAPVPPSSNATNAAAAAADGFTVRFDLAINSFTVLKCVCTYERMRR